MTTTTDVPSTTAPHVETAGKLLVESVVSIVSTVCKVQPVLSAPQPQANGGGEKISGIVSLMGNADMTMFLGLSPETATVFAARFAGFAIPFESPDMADAVGELTNMVAGDLKIRLDRCAIKVNISIPTVFRGQDLSVTTPSWELIKEHSFTTECGSFTAGLCSKRKK